MSNELAVIMALPFAFETSATKAELAANTTEFASTVPACEYCVYAPFTTRAPPEIVTG